MTTQKQVDALTAIVGNVAEGIQQVGTAIIDARNEQAKKDAAKPSMNHLILTLPLYKTINLSPDDRDWLSNLQGEDFHVDAHCVVCGKERPFHRFRQSGDTRLKQERAGILVVDWFADTDFVVELQCGANRQHKIRSWFKIVEGDLVKVGQDPSMADIAATTLDRKFAKILGHDRAKELTQAVRLMASGVGTGSFVYLRRVFEGLVEDHKKAASAAGQPLPDDYDRLRMDDRIKALADRLPALLVSNRRTLYGLLSTAVHELDEQTCLDYFPAVHEMILLILEQDVATAAKLGREAEASKALVKITEKLSSL